MKNFRRVNNLLGWVVFLIAAFTYLSTMEGTASLWDCAEFIASTYKLEVGHPPGAPFFNILGRVFTLFSGPEAWTAGPNANAAVWINSLSALSSAFTILFLFWSISHLARRLLVKDGDKMSWSSIIIIVGSATVGALAYAFSDTFWFSAVEAEVYAMSSLFTAVVFWLILKWEDNADSPYSNRWIILIMYLMGLSVGVHLLNLLVIPAMGLVVYFKKYTFSFKGLIITVLVSGVAVVAMQFGVIPGIFYVASKIDFLTTNGMGLPLHTGTITYLILFLGTLVAGIYVTAYNSNKKIGVVLFVLGILLAGIPFCAGGALGIVIAIVVLGALLMIPYRPQILNIILTSILVIVLGYSSFAMVIIRANANPPMNENDPNDTFTLQSYLNRDQYGATPLLTGQYFSSIPVDYIDNGPEYNAIDGKYQKTSEKMSYKYEPQTTFPRMYSSQANHIAPYKAWAGMTDLNPGIKKNVKGREVWVPTKSQEMTYFINYQVDWMYWRYFFWNFSGRQNDTQGYGDPLRGNWISGIPFLDNGRVGSQDNLPSRMLNDPTRNVYYMLPFLLGLIGLGFQLFKKNKGLEGFLIVAAFFFMTGLAIILYLNQPPMQPRERDYAYAGSFYAYAIWIGLGVMGIWSLIKLKLKNEEGLQIVAVLVTVITLCAVPVLMAKENWADHNRSRRSVANDLAYNYLMSCAPNAILFTYGDNDTFPLWYLQEVEGVRTDVRVCNLSYFQIDWYIEQMAHKAYESDPFPFSLTPDKYLGDRRNSVILKEDAKNKDRVYNLKDAIKFVADDKNIDNRGTSYIPADKFYIDVDTARVLASGSVPVEKEKDIVSRIDLNLGARYISKQELMLLDLLAHNDWKRPIYFATSVGSDKHLGLSNYLLNEGFAYRLVPVNSGGINSVNSINTDVMYKHVMKDFRYGGLNKPGYILMDYQAERMFIAMRQSLLALAQALFVENKKKECLDVINKCLEEFPDRNLPMGYCSLSRYEMSGYTIGGLLANLGEKDRALAIYQEMADQAKEEVVWFSQQEDHILVNAKSDFETARSVYYNVEQQISKLKADPKIMQDATKFLEDQEQARRIRSGASLVRK